MKKIIESKRKNIIWKKKELQALCHWCRAEIFEDSVFKVKCFWNQGWSGRPICDKCSEGLKTNGKPSDEEFNRRLGLNIVKEKLIKRGLEKWL